MTEKNAPTRMSLTRMVELLMSRGTGERSSVTLTRNAKGETQIEVTVRTSDNADGPVPDVEAAEMVARDVYDRLRAAYPMADGHVGATGDKGGRS